MRYGGSNALHAHLFEEPRRCRMLQWGLAIRDLSRRLNFLPLQAVLVESQGGWYLTLVGRKVHCHSCIRCQSLLHCGQAAGDLKKLLVDVNRVLTNVGKTLSNQRHSPLQYGTCWCRCVGNS
ncbi:hypothetical protein H257_09242 [Aphanomyces astaci]|uniref:Uncharacterized protein n=1 Tax=Aphanomyces astaci TaxID=112090 RepID=W4GCJ1_APHAT|nr:hypothetical protein H257_09242 [Aphanomyces astaci]ETV76789.1 hypothetical protein H257_09242 [Aphanomyces astaci]|eukprot:XP_009833701.1 hypothetical protein H257_09242 [Aphanomyces astaci]